jgi:endopeptidase La
MSTQDDNNFIVTRSKKRQMSEDLSDDRLDILTKTCELNIYDKLYALIQPNPRLRKKKNITAFLNLFFTNISQTERKLEKKIDDFDNLSEDDKLYITSISLSNDIFQRVMNDIEEYITMKKHFDIVKFLENKIMLLQLDIEKINKKMGDSTMENLETGIELGLNNMIEKELKHIPKPGKTAMTKSTHRRGKPRTNYAIEESEDSEDYDQDGDDDEIISLGSEDSDVPIRKHRKKKNGLEQNIQFVTGFNSGKRKSIKENRIRRGKSKFYDEYDSDEQGSDVDEKGNLRDFIDYSDDDDEDDDAQSDETDSSYNTLNELLSDNDNYDSDDMKFIKHKYTNKRGIKNDVSYFSNLEKNTKKDVLEMFEKIGEINNSNTPKVFKALESSLPINVKAEVMKKINIIESDTIGSEGGKLSTWVDTLLRMPLGTYTKDPVTCNDSHRDITKYLNRATQTMNESVYGHEDAKHRILQIIAQNISNPAANGMVIGLRGPMGNGKTTLVEKGIARAIDRPFAHISLGGATESSFLEGHSYTYEGSVYGKIVDILLQTQTMNPVIYFDELDKISETSKGDEIVNILMHLLDPSQNKHFQDRYFSGIDLDMSKAIFVFSYNDSDAVNPILLDRITEINTKGFDTKNKLRIAKEYLIPDILKDVGFKHGDIKFNVDALQNIVEYYTFEGGVRQFKQLLYQIVREINLKRLTDTTVFGKKIKLPFIVSQKITTHLLSKSHIPMIQEKIHNAPQVGKINGLYATTNDTGGLVPIEAVEIPSDHKLFLEITGQQGEIMRESIKVAKTVAWNIITEECRNVQQKKWKKYGGTGIHIHCPEASIKKDGPSAGGAITVTMVSRFMDLPIRNDIAMTGEINLSGEITEIGGLEHKLFGAKKAGVQLVLYPAQNQRHIDKIMEEHPDLIEKGEFEVIPVSTIWDVLPHVFEGHDIEWENYIDLDSNSISGKTTKKSRDRRGKRVK